MKKVEFVIQAKGGVGKSFVAFNLAQYIKEKTNNLKAIDTDTTNPTLLRYKELNVEYIQLTKNHILDLREFDNLIEKIIDADKNNHFVIDVGSNGFQPLMAYVAENTAFDVLKDEDCEVILNLIIAGGSDTEETMKGTLAILNQIDNIKARLWINEYNQPAILNGKKVIELKKWDDFKDKIIGFIELPRTNKDTMTKDIDEMLTKRITYDEYINNANLMPKKRIMNYKKMIWEQLDKKGV